MSAQRPELIAFKLVRRLHYRAEDRANVRRADEVRGYTRNETAWAKAFKLRQERADDGSLTQPQDRATIQTEGPAYDSTKDR